MKKTLLLLTALLVVVVAKSQIQDSTKVKKKVIIDDTWTNTKKASHRVVKHYHNNRADSLNILNVVKIVQTKDAEKLRVGQVGLKVNSDTTEIRLWKRKISITDGWHSSKIKLDD